jgi:hypothetical protein
MVDSNNPRPAPQVVAEFHTNSDVDSEKDAQHHTLGTGVNQASPGSHRHDGNDSFLLGEGVEITGAKGGNTAVASVIAAMVQMFGVKDSTT